MLGLLKSMTVSSSALAFDIEFKMTINVFKLLIYLFYLFS